MKKILFHSILALTFYSPIAFSLDISQLNNPSEQTDLANLSEEEAVATLHTMLGVFQLVKIGMTKANINNIPCRVLPTIEENKKQQEQTINEINKINYDNPKIKALKEEIFENFNTSSEWMLSRELCKQQQKLLKQQKAVLEQTQS